MKHPQTTKEVEIANILKAILYHNGIVEIVWDTSINTIEVPHLIHMRQAVFELGNGKKMPLYFTAHDFLQLDKKGGDYAASPEGVKYTLATAVLIDNLAKKLIFNFFIKFNKPRVPTKGFLKKAEAFNWLEQIQS